MGNVVARTVRPLRSSSQKSAAAAAAAAALTASATFAAGLPRPLERYLDEGDNAEVTICETWQGSKVLAPIVIKRPLAHSPRAVAALAHEAAVLRALQPHVYTTADSYGRPMADHVPVFMDYAADGGGALWMDYKRGRRFDALLEDARSPPLPAATLKTIILRTAEVLQWLSAVLAGFRHGDLHPGNVLVDIGGDAAAPMVSVAIIDFGAATTLALPETTRALAVNAGGRVANPFAAAEDAARAPVAADLLHLCEFLLVYLASTNAAAHAWMCRCAARLSALSAQEYAAAGVRCKLHHAAEHCSTALTSWDHIIDTISDCC